MSMIGSIGRLIEAAPVPDAITARGIGWLVARTRRRLALADTAGEAEFVATMAGRPIAEYPQDANFQHYELPPEFFALVLGPQRKYSCCLYPASGTSLAAAEDHALAETMVHADLADGQRILELGCGWGSLSLAMATRFPAARITAVSNAHAQRRHIEAEAAARSLDNLRVVTADMNDFAAALTYDRVVSVEMFEHMANWPVLLERIRSWLAPQGRLFLHVFSHRSQPYRFDHADRFDWIAQHFFTGGLMPSHGMVERFGDIFAIEQSWRWTGDHYQRTALDWLANFDRHADAISRVMQAVYGRDAGLWQRRWRLFFLATAGLFGDSGGTEWGVSHYRLVPTALRG